MGWRLKCGERTGSGDMVPDDLMFHIWTFNVQWQAHRMLSHFFVICHWNEVPYESSLTVWWGRDRIRRLY